MWNKVKSLTNIRGNLLFDNLDNNKKKIFMKNNAQNTNFISRTSQSATRLLKFNIHLYTQNSSIHPCLELSKIFHNDE